MLGLRLDEPLRLDGLESAVDISALERLRQGGLVVTGQAPGGEMTLTLTRRGRFLGGGVTAELLV